jgi:undecaprenyl-diphosphatase
MAEAPAGDREHAWAMRTYSHFPPRERTEPALDQLIKVIVLALLQGVTELFPVSSLGHTVIIPGLLGWGNIISSDAFLPTVVVLHLGTAVALLTFFWRDWAALVRAFFKTAVAGRLDADPQGKTIWLVIVGTIPLGLAGLFLKDFIQQLFFSGKWPVLPAAFLCLNGAVLLVGERLRQRVEPKEADRFKQELAFKRVDELTFAQAFLIGVAQSFALLPGISRSGISMVAGMGARLRHEDAARFSFLLATPAIGLAGLVEVPKLAGTSTQALLTALVGGVVAGIAAFLSVKFLMRYFVVGRLTPFAIYCLVAGALALLVLTPLSLGWITLPW